MALITLSRGNAVGQSADLLHSGEQGNWIRGVDVSEPRTAAEKAAGLLVDDVKCVEQGRQLGNPDARVILEESGDQILLSEFARGWGGTTTSDSPKFRKFFWEMAEIKDGWVFQQSSVLRSRHFGGRDLVLLWEDGKGELVKAAEDAGATIAGLQCWGRWGLP